jgi:hypothetical protein
MRVIRKIAIVGAVAATFVGIGLGTGGTAYADPATTPTLTTLVGVGSGTMTSLFAGSPTENTAGSIVTDYNATSPTYPTASWDALNPSTGDPDDTIATKASGSGDASCNLDRPDGANAGITALNEDQEDSTEVDGQPVYCVDYVQSDSPPDTATYDDTFIALGIDAVDWSYPFLDGVTNPQPTKLTLADLEDIYTCQDYNWDQVGGSDAPIIPVLPQSGSGTRSTWLAALGITATTEPCWVNGTDPLDSSNVIEENTGLSAGNEDMFDQSADVFTTYGGPFGLDPTTDSGNSLDVIFPYSIGDWIGQGSAIRGTGTPGTPGGATVGDRASSLWGHGNLVLGDTENSLAVAEAPTSTNTYGQPVINPSFPSTFYRTLYAVVRNGYSDPTNATDAAFPTTPAYDATGLPALFGPSGWFCTNSTAQSDEVSYGFKLLGSACGSLTAGD